MDLDHVIIVALGGNLPGRFASSEALLEAALARFPSVGLSVRARSRWWRSAAWPDPAEPEYRNGVALVEAKGGPRTVLAAILTLEAQFGRQRIIANGPRTLDLDLIAHGRQVLQAFDLILPHPRAHQRLFVMGPLAEIAPAWRHPTTGDTAATLAATATIATDAR